MTFHLVVSSPPSPLSSSPSTPIPSPVFCCWYHFKLFKSENLSSIQLVQRSFLRLMPLALWPQVVPQVPVHFRSSETQFICDGSFACLKPKQQTNKNNNDGSDNNKNHNNPPPPPHTHTHHHQQQQTNENTHTSD